MKIGELATQQVVTSNSEATILDAARLMREHHVGDVVIVAMKDLERVPIGLITDRDIVVAVVAQDIQDLGSIRAVDVASQHLVTADADDSVEEVIAKMLAQGVRRVPVVNSLGALVGIVTYDDLVAWMAEELAGFARLFTRQRRREQQMRK